MPSGTVKFFNSEKGFGFIQRDDTASDIFIHVSQLKLAGINELHQGQRVDFEAVEYRGKLQAQSVVAHNEPAAAVPPTRQSTLVEEALLRTHTTDHDETTLDVWEAVIDYIKTGRTTMIHEKVVYGRNRQPGFDGEWGKLNAWCKLVGFRPVWVDCQAGIKEGGVWRWYWNLEIEQSGLPDERLKNKLLREYGAPPGY